jgi:hypothetical protein
MQGADGLLVLGIVFIKRLCVGNSCIEEDLVEALDLFESASINFLVDQSSVYRPVDELAQLCGKMPL